MGGMVSSAMVKTGGPQPNAAELDDLETLAVEIRSEMQKSKEDMRRDLQALQLESQRQGGLNVPELLKLQKQLECLRTRLDQALSLNHRESPSDGEWAKDLSAVQGEVRTCTLEISALRRHVDSLKQLV